MIIRKANSNDLEAIYDLYESVITSDSGHLTQFLDEVCINYVKSELEKSFDLGLSIVVEENNEIVGFMKAYTSEFKALAHVLTNTTIMIRSDHQKKGYGKEMVQYFCDYIENSMKHIYRFELLPHASNIKAIAFYLRNNFKVESTSTSRVFDIDGSFEDEVRLVWFNKNFNRNNLSAYHDFLSGYTKKLYK